MPRGTESGVRAPIPPGHPKTSTPFPAQPHTGLGPNLLLLWSVPQNRSPGVPWGPPSQLLPPGRCQRGPPGSTGVLGSPGMSGTELRAAGRKNPRHELCREKERGGLSAWWGAGGESPPRASPGRVGRHRPARLWVPVCPGPPGVRCPPSAPRSGAGPAHSEFPVTFPGMGSREWSQEAELIPRPAHAFPRTRPPLTKRGEPGVAGPPARWRRGLGGIFGKGWGGNSGWRSGLRGGVESVLL